jgi:cephalosporin-C deacetylase-like acetyl esterase
LVHGKDGRIEDMVPFAYLLAARGYASIIPEVVGHGARNNGVPLFDPDPIKMRDGFIESTGDIRRSIDVLHTIPEVDPNRIGLVGVSMGAILGTLTTALDERLRTCVLIVGGGDWQTIFAQSQERFARSMRAKGPLPPEAIAVADDFDPKNFAAHISPRPLLMISGKRDSIIPPDSARILFAAAREPKKQIWVDSGHVMAPADAAIPGMAWLDQYLKSAAAPEPVAVPASLFSGPHVTFASWAR